MARENWAQRLPWVSIIGAMLIFLCAAMYLHTSGSGRFVTSIDTIDILSEVAMGVIVLIVLFLVLHFIREAPPEAMESRSEIYLTTVLGFVLLFVGFFADGLDDFYEVSFQIKLVENLGIPIGAGLIIFSTYRWAKLRIEEVRVLERTSEELRERKKQLAVLDRVLRHNMYNDMNVITGYAEMLQERLTGEEKRFAQSIRETGEKLLVTTDKEREVVQIIEEERGREELDLVDAGEKSWQGFVDRWPDAEITVEFPEEAVVYAVPQIERALEELVENAVTHSDRETPEVQVSVESSNGEWVLKILDNGPSIPEQEIKVLTGEHEIEPLYHGSRMGLWLVNWVTRRSEGEIEFHENETRGNTVRISLPKAK